MIPLHEITHELVQKGYEGICSLELFNPATGADGGQRSLCDRGGKDSPLLNSLMLPQQEMDNRRAQQRAGRGQKKDLLIADKRRQQARYWSGKSVGQILKR